jgi:hypothetical protein
MPPRPRSPHCHIPSAPRRGPSLQQHRTAITPTGHLHHSAASPPPPPRLRPARLHDASHPTTPHRTEPHRPRSKPDSSRTGHAAAPPPKVAGKIFLPRTDLPAPMKGPARLPTSPRTAPTESPCFLEPPNTTAPTTIAGRCPTPRSLLHKQSRPKVSTGLRSPRFPLRFPLSPTAADP